MRQSGRGSTSVRRVGLGLGVLRCVIGAGMMVDPSRLAKLLGTDSVTAAQTGWLTRMVGGREIALGLGSLAALSQGSSGAHWYAAQAVADGGDAFALFAAVRAGRVSAPIGSLIAASALVGAVLEVAVTRAAWSE